MKALIITVGVGISEDKEKAAKDLAHGIAFSINGNNPDKVFFITTKEGKELTIPFILEFLKSKFKSEKNYEIEEIKDANDFDECFDIVTKTIDKALSEGFKVTVDFTSGTKVMSAGAVLASIFKENIELCIPVEKELKEK